MSNKKSDDNVDNSTKRYSLQVDGEKRGTVGFHIYPKYNRVIETIAFFKRIKPQTKGEALEHLVNFYLSHIPESRLKEIMEVIEHVGTNEEDEW